MHSTFEEHLVRMEDVVERGVGDVGARGDETEGVEGLVLKQGVLEVQALHEGLHEALLQHQREYLQHLVCHSPPLSCCGEHPAPLWLPTRKGMKG